MQEDVLNNTYKLIDCIKSDPRYKRAKELSVLIDEKYKAEADAMHAAEEKYNEALKYGSYHPDLKKLELSYSEAKKALYSKDEVLEYLKLYKELQSELDIMFNKIKEGISDKLTLTKIYRWH